MASANRARMSRTDLPLQPVSTTNLAPIASMSKDAGTGRITPGNGSRDSGSPIVSDTSTYKATGINSPVVGLMLMADGIPNESGTPTLEATGMHVAAVDFGCEEVGCRTVPDNTIDKDIGSTAMDEKPTVAVPGQLARPLAAHAQSITELVVQLHPGDADAPSIASVGRSYGYQSSASGLGISTLID